MQAIRRTTRLAAILLAWTAHADVIYVDASADPGGTGASWATACPNLHTALQRAAAGDEVWVAAGTYRAVDDLAIPTPFRVPGDVQVRGGFDGTEGDPNERLDPLPETILTADIFGDDGPGFTNRFENGREVVRVADGGAGTLLDGLIVEGAEKRDGSSPGAGVRVDAGNLTMRRCVVRLNRNRLDDGRGAGLGVQDGVLTLIDCHFHDNQTSDRLVSERSGGAGVYVGNSTVSASGCLFTANLAETLRLAVGDATGAGMLIEATGDFVGEATLRDCRFVANNATNEGGGLFVEVADDAGLQLLVADCLFERNDADEGGGMLFRRGSASNGAQETSARLVGTSFAGNTARWVAGFAMAGGSTATEVSAVELDGCWFEANHTVYEASYNVGSSGAVLRANEIVVRNTHFIENVAEAEFPPPSAGATLLPRDRAVLENSTFIGNRIIVDGGVNRLRGEAAAFYVEDVIGGPISNVLMRNVVSAGNRSRGAPGGLLEGINRAFLINVTIAGNQALEGGGGLHCDAPMRIRNSVVAGNRTGSIADPVVGLQLTGARDEFEVSDCILERLGEQLALVERTIEADPRFADLLGPDRIFATGDESFALHPQSPCIDRGNNDWLPADAADLDGDGDTDEPIPFDAAGNPRLLNQGWLPDTGLGQGPIVDIGAYEYPFTCPGDLNGDNAVDLSDLAGLLSRFGLTADGDAAAADLQPNGLVDLSDLATMLVVFGNACPQP